MAAAGDIIISVKPEHAHNIIVGRKTVASKCGDLRLILAMFSDRLVKDRRIGCEAADAILTNNRR